MDKRFPRERADRDGERETRKNRALNRMKTALVLSAALHIGGIFHKEIGSVVEDIPDRARAALRSREGEELMQKLLQEAQAQLDSGEVIDIDLSEFHLAHEYAVGGVSDGEREEAQQKYSQLIKVAQRMKSDKKDFDEVMGYILKHQGKYKADDTFMTHLLSNGEGNCVAREKYISSALQDLYPEIVESGSVKTQVFGEYIDPETGEARAGHVRVIVEQGGGKVMVLEGDSVQVKDASEMADIPDDEVTQSVVKSALAAQGLYNYNDEQVARPKDIASDDLSLDYVNIDDLKIAWNRIGYNSVNAFPESTAHYVAATQHGTVDIVAEPVAGSWGHSSLQEWDPIELSLRKELDPEHLRDIVTSHGNNKLHGSYPLYQFDNVDADVIAGAFEDARTLLQEGAFSQISLDVAGYQVPPPEVQDALGQRRDLIRLHLHEPFYPDAWDGYKHANTTIEGLVDIPEGVEDLEFNQTGSLTLQFQRGVEIVLEDTTRGVPRHPILSSGVPALSFESGYDLTRKQDIGAFDRLLVEVGTFAGDADATYQFDHMIPSTLALARAKEVLIDTPAEALYEQPGFFWGSEIGVLRLKIDKRKIEKEHEIFSEGLWNVPNEDSLQESTTKQTHIKEMYLDVPAIDRDAFNGARIDYLRIYGSQLLPGALNGADIGRLSVGVLMLDVEMSLTDDTSIDFVEFSLYMGASLTTKNIEDIQSLCRKLEKQKIDYGFKLSGQFAPKELQTFEQIKERWAKRIK